MMQQTHLWDNKVGFCDAFYGSSEMSACSLCPYVLEESGEKQNLDGGPIPQTRFIQDTEAGLHPNLQANPLA